MIINLADIGKKYDRHWVFRHINYELKPNEQYVLLGNNGSGKSTLLKIIAGLQQASEGAISWTQASKPIKKEQLFQYISFCAPAMDIIEEMTLKEFLKLHFSFKQLKYFNHIEALIELLELESERNKKIEDFSSGMKQRVKLAQAFFSDTAILCLDEPTSNLDDRWIQFYQSCLEKYTADRTVIIASNDSREYFSHNIINLLSYK